MKLIGNGEPPSKLHTGFGLVDKKAVERWEPSQKFLMEEIGKSLAEKANRILRECDAFKGCLAPIKEALLEEEYNYKTNFGIIDDKLDSIRSSQEPNSSGISAREILS